MRVKINFEANGVILPSHNQHMVNGFVHKCLGKNNEFHDAPNDYCVSMLAGGRLFGQGKLIFDKEMFLVISGDENFVSKFVSGALSIGSFNGNRIIDINPIVEKFYDGQNHFATLSPILLKRYDGKSAYKFYRVEDEDYESALCSHTKRRLQKVIPDIDVSKVKVTVKCHGAKTKRVIVKNVANVANAHYVTVECTKEIAATLHRIGLGQSTGSGFGTIYKTENKSIYFAEK